MSVPVGLPPAPPIPPIPPIPPTPPIPLELDDELLELLLTELDALDTLPPAPPIPPELAPPIPPAPLTPPDPPVSPELLEELLDELLEEPLAELDVSDPVPLEELPSSVPVAQAQRETKRAKDPRREKRMLPLYAFGFDDVKRDWSNAMRHDWSGEMWALWHRHLRMSSVNMLHNAALSSFVSTTCCANTMIGVFTEQLFRCAHRLSTATSFASQR